MTDEGRLPDPTAAICRLNPGDGVIFRHYGVRNRAALARKLARLCRLRGVLFLVGGDGRLARAVGADGLHLPENTALRGPRRWRLWIKPCWLLTMAAHSPAALAGAARLGVHAALLSPVFATESHALARPLGALRFTAWARAARVPVYGLGGMNGAGWRRIRASRAVGRAGVGNY